MTNPSTTLASKAEDSARTPDDFGRKVNVSSPTRQVIQRFSRHKLAMTGLIIFLIIALMAIFAPVVTRYDPNLIVLTARSQPPSLDHWFGTDRTGRDVYSRVVYAGRVSILVGVVAVLISVIIALILGSVAGFFGGKADMIIMRFTDVIMTFPPVVIFVTVAAIAGPGLQNTILVIGLLTWPVPCRLVRAKILSVRETEYVTAARAIGAPTHRIIAFHAMPNVIDVIVVYSTLGIAVAILLEAGLSFLGLGVQQPTSSWGNMLNVARNISVLESSPMALDSARNRRGTDRTGRESDRRRTSGRARPPDEDLVRQITAPPRRSK